MWVNLSALTPIHETDDKTDKLDYRAITTLPNLSKVYEKPKYDQIYEYFGRFSFDISGISAKDLITKIVSQE